MASPAAPGRRARSAEALPLGDGALHCLRLPAA